MILNDFQMVPQVILQVFAYSPYRLLLTRVCRT